MGNPSDKSPELVTIAAAPSVLNANIIVTTLEAEGITAFIPDENTSTILSHMNFAINPYGIRVVVSADDVEAAAEILGHTRPAGESDSDGEEAEDQDATEAETYARRSARSALFCWLLPPTAILTLYWLVKALRAAADDPPGDRKTFNRNLWAAAWLGIVLGTFMGVFWILTMVRWPF